MSKLSRLVAMLAISTRALVAPFVAALSKDVSQLSQHRSRKATKCEDYVFIDLTNLRELPSSPRLPPANYIS